MSRMSHILPDRNDDGAPACAGFLTPAHPSRDFTRHMEQRNTTVKPPLQQRNATAPRQMEQRNFAPKPRNEGSFGRGTERRGQGR